MYMQEEIPMIEVKNVSKRYGKHVALDNVSFTVESGRIYGLLGENGAGKSTTMNIITGYLALTSGEITVDGFDIVKNAKKAKQKIGYLPELPPLYQDMTVEEYLKFVSELKGIPRKERKNEVKIALEKSKTMDVKKRLIKNLSKGYKQRVGIAQAILGSPEIVILDEPTVGLDPMQITEIRDLIREIGKEHTVILSSHILSEISEVCDHVFMISKGRLVLDEDMDKIDSLEKRFIELAQTTVEEDASDKDLEKSTEESKEESTEESKEESTEESNDKSTEEIVAETKEETAKESETESMDETSNESEKDPKGLEIISLDEEEKETKPEKEDKISRRKIERKKKFKNKKNKNKNKEEEE